jgi:quercetin dioxygenase-like cupin family protein
MKRIQVLVSVLLMVGIAVGVLGHRMLSAQEQLRKGTILQRAELTGVKGKDAILVLRDLPPGAESGKHMQSGNEIVYILEGSVILEMQGKPPVTLKAGEAFQTKPGEVHNVKNASPTAPGKALAFYVAKKGAPLADISIPVK